MSSAIPDGVIDLSPAVLTTAGDTHPGAHYKRVRSASRTEVVGVVIPAHNHAATISKCISSIFEASSYSGWQNALWIVVVADACTDQTAKVARRTIGAFGEVLEVTAQSLRTARRIGESTLLDHFRHRPRHTIMLASTDADDRVPRDWIAMIMSTLKIGAHTQRSA